MIEDDVLFSDLLTMTLRARVAPRDLRVFATGREGLAHCLVQQPDLLIVDLGLPDGDGREIIRRLRSRWPELRVLVLTGQVSRTLPGELMALGVSGFVEKGSPYEETEKAVRRVLADGMYFSAGLAPMPSRVPWTDGASPERLTKRELEIVRLVARGMISKEIGAQLKLSPRTIEKSRAQIMEKLGLRDLPALVRWSLQHGLG